MLGSVAVGLKGLNSGSLSEAVTELAIRQDRCEVVEATGCAGDILLMHPLLLHARSKNIGSTIIVLMNETA